MKTEILNKKTELVNAILYWKCQIVSSEKMIVLANENIRNLTKEFDEIENTQEQVSK